ncbi:MAG: CHAT domain-containing protein [Hydrococcus sp. SU_1_0]|nr:CHAT domain-containing protein [Hydrococcus sp. SU_1_0]
MTLVLTLELTNSPMARAKEVPIAREMLNQAQNYYLQRDYNQAILLLNKLLKTPQQIDSVTIRSNLAEIYRHLGQYNQAIAHWKTAIESIETKNDEVQKPKLIALKIDLARAYTHLGQTSLAIPLLEEAIILAKQERKPEIEGIARKALGDAERVAGEYDRAITAYNTSLNKTQDYESIVKILNGLVEVYQLRRQQNLTEAEGAKLEKNDGLFTKYNQLANTDRTEAIKYAKQAVAVSADKNLTSLATVRALLNWQRLSPNKETKISFEQISDLLARLPASRSKVYLLVELAEFEQPEAVEILSQAVKTASALGDKRALSFALGALGNTYEKRGELKQAFFWTQKAQLAAQEVFATDSLYQWQWQAARLYLAMGADDSARDAYQGAIASVQNIRNDLLNAEKQMQLDIRSQVEPIYREYIGLLLKSGDQAQTKKAFNTADLLKLSQLQSYFKDDCLEIQPNSQPNKALTRSDTVIIRSIILEDKTYLILRLPDGTFNKYPVKIKAKQLEKQIDEWRYSLEELSSEGYLVQSQSLYKRLLRPLAKDLEAIAPSRIVFINDGRLLNVPMAALHDGQKFLIEKYAISYSLGLNSISKRETEPDDFKTLAFGLTVPKNEFPALTNVQQEIEDLAKFVDVRQFLNQEFTQENFQQQLDKGYSIVHLATHAQFGGSPENSFIQAFDQKILLNDLEAILSSLQQSIKLLVLSACQTAAGNDRSVLGLAGIVARSGIDSVVGSLWAVNDAQTVSLMEDFYKYLSQESLNESEALRAAQLEQIEQPLGHPGIWSSFLVIE